MTDERTGDVRTLAFVLLAVSIAVILFVPAASAQEATCTEVLENRSSPSNASGAPGGLLADAIGDHRDEIGNELENRSFEARLENATSARERAAVVAEEVERIEANVSTLERCWGINRTEAEANRTLAELDADERETLANRSRSLRDRLNETRDEADSLPRSLREANDVDAERLASLERRILEVRDAVDDEGAPTERPFPFP